MEEIGNKGGHGLTTGNLMPCIMLKNPATYNILLHNGALVGGQAWPAHQEEMEVCSIASSSGRLWRGGECLWCCRRCTHSPCWEVFSLHPLQPFSDTVTWSLHHSCGMACLISFLLAVSVPFSSCWLQVCKKPASRKMMQSLCKLQCVKSLDFHHRL